MPCFHPLQAWQSPQRSKLYFRNPPGDASSLQVPCGQCIGCRLERSRQWAVRCMHEASLHKASCYITLTYDGAHLPSHGQLVYRDFQLFMKRLRKLTHPKPVRFFMAGEYGDTLGRPHFHALIFGHNFNDKTLIRSKPVALYKSGSLSALWPYGFASVGEVTFESAAYVARYNLKKITGEAAAEHYQRTDPDTGEIIRLVPEFTRMSLKPGIAGSWFDQFNKEVYPFDEVIVRGNPVKPPKYYDRLLERIDPDLLDQIKIQREADAELRSHDNTPARLAVKKICAQARASQSIRKLS